MFKRLTKRIFDPFVHQECALSKRRTYDSDHDHKVQQLITQIRRTLSLVLENEIRDPLLNELFVEEIVPFPNASRLLVLVRHVGEASIEVGARLNASKSWLRTQVAGAIHRKRAPDLIFEVLSEQETRLEESV